MKKRAHNNNNNILGVFFYFLSTRNEERKNFPWLFPNVQIEKLLYACGHRQKYYEARILLVLSDMKVHSQSAIWVSE
jgi:hypothetical protein